MYRKLLIVSVALVGLLIWSIAAPTQAQRQTPQTPQPVGTTGRGAANFDQEIQRHAQSMIDEGRKTFRFDTFGDEAFWGDQLKLHQAIAGQKLGGVGPGLSPAKALELGLKVDSEMVPPDVA